MLLIINMASGKEDYVKLNLQILFNTLLKFTTKKGSQIGFTV